MTFGWGASFADRLARLTLVLFALRALAPAGYMPDLGALDHGQVRIVICTGAGFQTVLVDEAGQPVDGQDASTPQHAGDSCPFGTASAKAFVAPAPVAALALPALEQSFLLPGSETVPLPPARGPPLGPRAPPVRLG